MLRTHVRPASGSIALPAAVAANEHARATDKERPLGRRSVAVPVEDPVAVEGLSRGPALVGDIDWDTRLGTGRPEGRPEALASRRVVAENDVSLQEPVRPQNERDRHCDADDEAEPAPPAPPQLASAVLAPSEGFDLCN
jgi:hypothetical protein